MTIFLIALVLLCMTALVMQRRLYVPRLATGGFSFFEEDDSDIKIAGEEHLNKTDDAITDANELEAQRQNGNLKKARELGTELTNRIKSEDGESDFGQDSCEDDLTRIQRRLLLVFAALDTVKANIKSPVLQGVVLNVFYNTLKSAQPEFYEDINESGSFSFYTLCVRRGGNVEEEVGRTFAMLTDNEGSTVMEELGKALFLRFVDVTEKAISSFNFI
jgi:hypothetical protein